MKSKLLVIFAFVLISGIFTACSEEVVEPQNSNQVKADGQGREDGF